MRIHKPQLTTYEATVIKLQDTIYRSQHSTALEPKKKHYLRRDCLCADTNFQVHLYLLGSL